MRDDKKKEIKIRNLAMGDVPSVARIRIDGWRKAYGGIVDGEYLNSLDVEEQAQKFVKCVGSDNFIVAIMDGEVVGFCRFLYDNSFSPNIDYVDCELTAIYVRPDLNGKGIGAEMFNDVVKKFKNRNKTNMIVWCLADNTDSIEFYKHIGGEIKEEKIVQIGDKNYKEVGIVYNLAKLE